ncbi:hypothetical protein BCR34DRAFT_603732 [Clohesyomyces aquaticus]|uniref:NACHT-NTPase and P-loop NTPases N-terminal domain-containing protein n=1 Tax=Clohesyomyces aquaticus TaxID=1231657 RepID=A0A1Y1ZCE4_9PLEO|nr:hypothetical protein BCR34DRAFT_603732 [Clohesyomyces aquaticus]
MASPVSIGDAILLSKLAYRLGHALTIGRKSAPEGLEEVQNQLYSLGRALEYVASRLSTKQTGQDPVSGPAWTVYPKNEDEAIEQVVRNCKNTLERLETLVEKYNDLQQRPAQEVNRESGTGWQSNLKTNLKKVRWTMQGEELDAIREDLHVHIASLNLLISGMTQSTQRVEGKLEEVHVMMKDVHDWYTRHLKPGNSGKRRVTGQTSNESMTGNESSERSLSPFFEIAAELPANPNPIVLCPRVSFREGWIESLGETSGNMRGVFVCNCERHSGTRAEGPHSKNIGFSLISISLLVRIPGSVRSWQIFCASDQVTSLIVRSVTPEGKEQCEVTTNVTAWAHMKADLEAFQEQVDLLAGAQAIQSLMRGASSTSIYHSTTENGQSYSILDLKSKASQFRGQICAVSFLSNGRRFSQHSIDTAQFLHYRTQSANANLLHEGYAEFVLKTLAGSAGISQFTIQMTRKTCFQRKWGLNTIQLVRLTCRSEEGGRSDEITCEEIEIECVSPRVEQELYSMFEAVRQELQLQYLQYPRVGESVVGSREYGDILIDHLYLMRPRATVVFDPEGSMHRLILRSSSGASVVAIELPSAFLKTISESPGAIESVELRAHFIEHDVDRTRHETGSAQLPQAFLEGPVAEMKRLGL